MNWFKKFWKGLNQPMAVAPRSGTILSSKERAMDDTANFTPRASQILMFARKEAERLNHNFLGTEHLLLGLIMLGQGVAVNVLRSQGV
jgi:ATP-dependent Clp protease ATP-binding subunit ClpA